MENENFDISQGTEVETTATAPEENQNAAEDTVSSTVSEETNVDEKANPRNYTKEEQAAYSFRKQLTSSPRNSGILIHFPFFRSGCADGNSLIYSIIPL